MLREVAPDTTVEAVKKATGTALTRARRREDDGGLTALVRVARPLVLAVDVEEHRRLAVVDLGPAREPLDDQVAQVLDVAHRHVHLQVVHAADVEDGEHLRQRQQVGVEAAGRCRRACLISRTATSASRPMPSAAAATSRVMAAQHARAGQGAHALQAAGRRQPDPGGQLLVAEPSIVLQSGHDREVDSVEWSWLRPPIRSVFDGIRTSCRGDNAGMERELDDRGSPRPRSVLGRRERPGR